MLRYNLSFLLATAGLAASLLAGAPAGARPRVVASIKPLHALVSGVMVGVGSPALLVKGQGSPHSIALRPSAAWALRRAQVVFWVGPNLEAGLNKPLAALAGQAAVVALGRARGLALLRPRRGGFWGPGSAGEEEATPRPAGPGETEHHVWLDPVNARALVAEIVEALSGVDPANRDRYHANGRALAARLRALHRELEELLAPVAARRGGSSHAADQPAHRGVETLFFAGIDAGGTGSAHGVDLRLSAEMAHARRRAEGRAADAAQVLLRPSMPQ